MKTLFNVEGVSRDVKIQFGLSLLLLILSPILTFGVWRLWGSFDVLGFPAHILFVLPFQVLLGRVIIKRYGGKMKLSYDKTQQIYLHSWLAPFMAFIVNWNDVTTCNILSLYLLVNIAYISISVVTEIAWWERLKRRFRRSK